jgi:hypothetical protein
MRALVRITLTCLLSAVAATANAATAAAAAITPPAGGTAPVGSSIPASGTMSDGDAAAKHAKRTACLKEAKARKLVGEKKTAFVKDCVAAP